MKTAIKASTMQKIRVTIISLLIILLMAVSIISTLSSVSSHDISSDRADIIINLNRFMNGSAYLTSEVRAYAATANKEHFDNYWNEVNNLKNRDIGVENMINIGLSSEEEAIIQQMQNLSNELIPLESAAMDLVDDGNLDEAVQSVFGDSYESTLLEIKALQVELSEMMDTRTDNSVERAYETSITISVIIAIILIIILLVQIFSEVIIYRKVIKPITTCSDALSEISKGHLSYKLNVPSNTSEIGILAESTKQTVGNLSTIIHDLSNALTTMSRGDFTYVSQVEQLYVGEYRPLAFAYKKITTELPDTLKKLKGYSNQVRVGSEHLSDNSQSLAQGASEQLASITELFNSIDSITNKINQTADDSKKAKIANEKAQSALMQSDNQVKEMISAMSLISNKSEEISKIIKTIDDIASQTNILSLNASVEAARAGAAGKGFAVVAEEVGNLATKSSESSKDIGELIAETLKAVSQGNNVAKNTAQSIADLFVGAGELATLVDAIAVSTVEQTEAAGTIKQSVEQISSVVNTNSSAAEQTAAVSEELLGQAHNLKELTSRFNL